MTANKTQPTELSVKTWLEGITDPVRRRDCEQLYAIMAELTGTHGVIWGDSLVGFGQYHYRYESGREGDFFRTGFASRKAGMSIYLMACGMDQHQLLPQLGKHKMGKSCLTVKRLSDIDLDVLKQLLLDSLQEMARRYPD
ncbi:DUF1801 domain-containing protein [Shewanella submarina]|uniref:DUF1801 domain-containing protein n=1 Tax=Shewanella submarina TaxID=2016376 RepID=A0ABV7GIC3_9GAMM|nr:DUF1801 domain-containing protein [Shewanella submarina]MCL1035720.1 DUF1801 domain-containing protein [Shewanella submarina]